MPGPWEEFKKQDGPWSEYGATPAAPPEKPKATGVFRKAGDVGLSIAKGIIGVPETAVGLADLVSGGAAGKAVEGLGVRFKDAKQVLTDWQSDDLKGKQQDFQQADGVVDKLGVALSNPSLIANTVAESLPVMGAGGVVARGALGIGARGVSSAAGGVGPAVPGLLARTVGAEAAPVVAGAIGEGVAGAGSAAEQIRQESPTGYTTGTQNLLAAGSGVATGLISVAGGALARRMGIADPDAMIAAGTRNVVAPATARGAIRRTAEGAVAESLFEEVPQSLSEQAFQNAALGRPLTEGMADAGVMGGLASTTMGGVAGALARPAVAPAPTAPPAGPLTRAAMLALPAPVVHVDGAGRAKMDGVPSGGFDRGQQEGAVGRTDASLTSTARDLVPSDTINVDGQGNASPPPQPPAGAPPRQRGEPGPRETGAFGAGRGSESANFPLAGDIPPPQYRGPLGAAAGMAPQQPAIEGPRALAGPDTITDNGQPFRSGVLAQRAARQAGLGFRPVAVEGGWVVRRDTSQAEDAQIKEPTNAAQPRLQAPAATAAAPDAQPAGDRPSLGPDPEVRGPAGSAPQVVPEAEAVHQAATSPLNDLPEPSDAQKAAGNYKLGRMRIAGLNISVENPQGSTRRGTDEDGRAWETPMAQAHYGYVRGTTAADGDKLDVFVKPGTAEDYAGPVFVIDQVNPKTGKFDEHKVVMGAADQAEAEAIYRSSYEPDWTGMAAITALPMEQFQAWAKSDRTKKPLGNIKRPAATAPTPADSSPAPASQALPDAPGGVRPGRADAVQPSAAPAAAVAPTGQQPAPASAEPGRYGRDGQDLAEGGKPFKTKDGAQAFRKKHRPQSRVVKVDGGYALRDKTDAEIKNDEAAGKRRMSAARAASYEKNPFLTFLAEHGLYHEKDKPRSQKVEFSPDRQISVPGYSIALFRKTGKMPDALLQPAIEDGYLPQGASESQLEDLIRKAVSGQRVAPLYSEGAAEQEMERRIEAQQEEEPDWLGPMDDADLEDGGFDQANDDLQAEVRELMAALEAQGVDYESVLEDVTRKTQNGTQNEYLQAAKQALQSLQAAQGVQPGGEGAGGPVAGARGNEAPAAAASAAEEVDPKTAATAALIEEARRFKYRNGTIERLLDRDTGETDPADGFTQHLFEVAMPRARAYDRIMRESNGDPSGIEFKSEGTGRARYAVVLPDASQQGKWRISYFDERGFSSHHVEETRDAAVKSMVSDGFTIESRGTLDELAATREWKLGTDYADIIDQLNRKIITHDEFMRLQAKLNEDYERDKNGAPRAESVAQGPDLAAPTQQDVLAQQERRENADALDERARIDREAAGQTLTAQTAPEQRKDTTIDIFGGPTVEDAMAEKARKDAKAGKPPAGPDLFSAADPEPAEPAAAPAPSADTLRAQADLNNALADLGDLLGRPFRANIAPEQEAKLVPILTRVLDAAFRMGYYKFKDAARFALDTIREKIGADVADALTLEHLQGAYIAMSGKYRDKGADKVAAVAAVESLDELAPPAPTAAPAPAAPAPPAASQPKAKPTTKIDDFGQKLEGARKDYAATLKDAEAVDIAAEPLSKSWPEPDYDKLLAGGADPYVVAFVHAARDEVPTKPQKGWKLKGWVQSVETLRGASKKLLAGEISKDRVQTLLNDDAFGAVRRAVGSRAELYELVGHAKSLKGVTFAENHYTLYKGQNNVRKWVVEQKAKATAFSNWPRELAVADTKAEMLEQFKAKFSAESLDGDKAKAATKGQFIIYRKRNQEGAFIGKKIGREYIDLKKLPDVAAARAYLESNTADLSAALERYKDTPFERNAENRPRVGDDHRNGAAVTPEVFADTFGFRGVQFGNYVEQDRRQSDLNQTFDALMDMAAVLGVPPRALSLNGRLGLAFGARGKGGKNAPAAHYEPDTVVINLTKGNGPGSLGHEWWHAVDNYFGKEFGAGGFATDGARVDRLRAEMQAAFKAVRNATQVPTLRKRAAELDKRRTKPYWNTPLELSARAFESYLIAKLNDQGAANDYLANVVDEKVWNLSEEARATFFGGEAVETYPYPGQAELPAVRAGFDEFFKVVQTREDDAGNVAMFSRVSRRDFLMGTAAALASPAVSADTTLGRARPVDANVMSATVSPAVAKILRGNGATNPDGANALREALGLIAKEGPPSARTLAARILPLLPKSNLLLTVDDRRRMNAHGAVTLSPVPHLQLFTAEGRTGLSYGTLLHESLHVAVAARYRSLSTGLLRSNDARLGMGAPKASEAMAQFRAVWDEFRAVSLTDRRDLPEGDVKMSLQEAADDPDEFFVRALTDPRLQAWLAGREYQGKTLLARFLDWVKSSLLGMRTEGTKPSWLDAALLASDDLLRAMDGDPADFSRLAAVNRMDSKREAAAGGDAVFSRAQLRRADPTIGRELRVTEIQKAVSRLTAGWLRQPDIHILDSMEDLEGDPDLDRMWQQWQRQNSQGGTGAIEGFHYRGGVYLLADALVDEADVRRVLFHEALGHWGLRNVFGAQLNPILDQIATMRQALGKAKATQYGLAWTIEQARDMIRRERIAAMDAPDSPRLDLTGAEFEKAAQARLQMDRRDAAEEVLAEMAQTRPELGWVQRTISAIRRFLRAHGVSLGLSDNDIIANYILPARGWVERGRAAAPSIMRGPAMAARSNAGRDPFYSALAAEVDKIGAKAMPGMGWQSALNGLVNKGAVKADEVEWSGIREWLDLQQGKVSKEAVLAYLAANGVQVQEVTLAEPYKTGELDSLLEQWAARHPGPTADAILAGEPWNTTRAIAQREGNTDVVEMIDRYDAPTKYGQYQLPGGSNYRELLLTLPEDSAEKARKLAELDAEATRLERAGDPRWREVSRERGELLRAQSRDAYRSSHWDTPNVLAHIRLNDRTDADGKRTLFVEEIQSDFAQDARKRGINKPPTAEQRAEMDAIQSKISDGTATIEDRGRYTELAGRSDGVPSAPFIDSTDKWLTLALKRVMVMAAQEGYDRVAFVNGEQSAGRYSLDQRVDRLSWKSTRTDGAARDVQLDIPDNNPLRLRVDGDGSVLAANGPGFIRYEGKRLDEIIGKDLADKVLKEPNGELSGDGLKVEAKGMRAFYDKIVPAAVNKLLGKVGGGKIADGMVARESAYPREFPSEAAATEWAEANLGDHEFTVRGHRESDGTFIVFDEFTHKEVKGLVGRPQPGFDITPDMREKVAGGMPMFSRQIDQTETEAFRRWFGDSKVVDTEGNPLVVYHGTRSDVAAFADDKVKGRFPNSEGFYFTSRPQHASVYADSIQNASEDFNPASRFAIPVAEGANVMPAYVSLQNPKVLTVSAWGTLESRVDGDGGAQVRAAREAGHDGVIVKREAGDEWDGMLVIAFRPEQIKSAIGNNGDFDPANPDIMFSRSTIAGATTRQYSPEQQRAMRNVGFEVDQPTYMERAQALWKDAGKKLAQGIADQFAPVKEISQEAYSLLRLSKGASGAFETMLHGGKLKLSAGVYDFDEANRGGVLDSLLIPLQGEHHDFFRWVAANRAERLAREGKENLFTAQDIADLKTLASGQLAQDFTLQHGPRAGQTTRDRAEAYRDSLATFNGFNKNVLDLAEQSGLIDGESRHLWEHEFYVPFYRVAEDADGGIRGANIKTGVVRQEAFKKLKGGKQALNMDLLDNTLLNWAHLLDAAAKNRGAKATLEAAQRMGIAVEAPERVAREIGTATGNKQGVVWFMDEGLKRYFVVDDRYILEALTSLEYAGMRNPVMDAMGAFKHALTVGVTASPFFKVRNLIRDSVQVIGTSGIGVNPAANVAQGWKLTDPKSDAYFRLLAGGGTIHFGTMLEGSEAKRVQALVESGVDSATILNSQEKVKAFYRKFIEPGITAYNELGNRGEAVNRAALYQQLRSQGMDHAQASLQARDLMDFSMQGTFTTVRFLTQVVPFFNARIQGMYKLGRAAKEDPARFSAVLGATALFSIALLAAYGDDDDWKKREEWDRNNYWWFKFGDTAFRIPKPFEIGAIGTLAERSWELAFDEEMTGTRFRKQVQTLLADNLSMNPIPQLIKPVVDVYANKDSFTGRPIETMDMERLRSDYRFTDRTSMFARGVSTAMNSVTGMIGAEALSPVQVDHMLRGYFGWLGAFIVGAGDTIARPATDQPSHPTPDYWKTVTGGMAADLRDAPSRYVSQMYDQAKEIEKAYGTWKMLIREGKVDEAREFRADNAELLNQHKQVERVKKAESALNQRARMIERSNMDPDRKRELLRQINEQKDRTARLAS